MNEKSIPSSSTRRSRTDWNQIRQMADAQIDYSDSPAHEDIPASDRTVSNRSHSLHAPGLSWG